jgi:proteic killer suppression protein
MLVLRNCRGSSIIEAVNVRFADHRLEKLETDASFEGGYGVAVVKAFRKRMRYIRRAADERDYYTLKSLHFEKLKGDRSHQYSMRLNDQWRLILEFEQQGSDRIVVIVKIEDYH